MRGEPPAAEPGQTIDIGQLGGPCRQLVGQFAQVGLIYVQAEDGGSPVTVYIDNVVFSGGN